MSLINIDINKEVTNRLKFVPQAEYNNLCLGVLKSVEFKENDSKETDENGMPSTWEYAGTKIPNIVFEFENHKLSTSDYERFYKHSESVINTCKKDGSAIDTKAVGMFFVNLWARIKHVADAYAGLNGVTSISEDKAVVKAFKVLFADEILSANGKDRAKAFANFYQAVANYFNEGGKDKAAIYTNVVLAMKLVAEPQNGKYLCFPSFVGEGFIERAKFDNAKKLVTKLTFKPNESIELTGGKKAAKAPASGLPGSANEAASGLDANLQALLMNQ